MTMWRLCALVHLVGLGLALGAATAKISLMVAAARDRKLVPVYLQVVGRITRLIILGLALLTLSGVGWLLLGRGFTPILIVKIGLAAAVWMMGPVIDKVVEPRFMRLAPAGDAPLTPEFVRARRQYLALEVAATGLMFAITSLGVLL